MRALNRFLKSALLKRDMFVGPAVAPTQLAGFFRAIRPLTTEQKLIRLGGDADGGYLLPDDLDGVEICFSPGVSAVADFELDLTQRGIQCFLADAAVVAPPIQHPLFDFERKHLASRDADNAMRLASWLVAKAPDGHDFILQMDIEGAEYDVILNTNDEVLQKFRIMVIEFHQLDRLADAFGFAFIRLAFEKLLQHFAIVHIHPNNSQRPVQFKGFEIPPVIEVTLLRNDRIAQSAPCRTFPHPLDRANVRKRGDLVLPRCWYAQD